MSPHPAAMSGGRGLLRGKGKRVQNASTIDCMRLPKYGLLHAASRLTRNLYRKLHSRYPANLYATQTNSDLRKLGNLLVLFLLELGSHRYRRIAIRNRQQSLVDIRINYRTKYPGTPSTAVAEHIRGPTLSRWTATCSSIYSQLA